MTTFIVFAVTEYGEIRTGVVSLAEPGRGGAPNEWPPALQGPGRDPRLVRRSGARRNVSDAEWVGLEEMFVKCGKFRIPWFCRQMALQ